MKVKTLKSVVNGNPVGSTIEVSANDGKYLIAKGLAEEVAAPKKETAKKDEPAKKKTSTTVKKKPAAKKKAESKDK